MLFADYKAGQKMFVRSNYKERDYRSGGFMIEPVGARDVLSPDSLDHDTQTRDAAMSAYHQRPGQPVLYDEYFTGLEEVLATLGATPIGRAFDAVEALALVPTKRVSTELKSSAAITAARLYAAESMAFRTAGLVLELLGEADVQTAVSEYPVEYAAVKRYAFEDVSNAADDLVEDLRGVNPYTRVVLRDTQPFMSVDRLSLAQQVLEHCLQTRLDYPVVGVDTFPVLVGRIAARSEESTAPPDWIMGHEQVVAESAKVLASQLLALVEDAAEEARNIDAGFLSQFFDFAIQLYALDSAVTRTVQLLNRRGIEKAKIHCDLTSLLVTHTVTRLRVAGKQLLKRVAPSATGSDLFGDMTTSEFLDVERANDRVFTHFVETSWDADSPE